MSKPPGTPTRRDALLWTAGIVAATIATVIFSAAGARLGSALTAGVIALTAVVVAGLAFDKRG